MGESGYGVEVYEEREVRGEFEGVYGNTGMSVRLDI
jgi:hypothetical protein